MTPDEIVRSQAFRVLNHLLDQKVIELKCRMALLKYRMRSDHDEFGAPRIVTRVPYECGEHRRVEEALPLDVHELRLIADLIRACDKLEREVRDLTSFKLKLLNDVNVTRGDDSDQVAVFGR